MIETVIEKFRVSEIVRDQRRFYVFRKAFAWVVLFVEATNPIFPDGLVPIGSIEFMDEPVIGGHYGIYSHPENDVYFAIATQDHDFEVIAVGIGKAGSNRKRQSSAN